MLAQLCSSWTSYAMACGATLCPVKIGSLSHSGQNITQEITQVKIHWKMPLKIQWTIPVEIHWESDNPLSHTTDK